MLSKRHQARVNALDWFCKVNDPGQSFARGAREPTPARPCELAAGRPGRVDPDGSEAPTGRERAEAGPAGEFPADRPA